MTNQITKILGIAPYEGLKNSIEAVAAHRDDVEVEVYIGDLSEGVEIAIEKANNGFDAIISRGGTAEMLVQAVSLPVIDIEISVYDILRGIKLAENYTGQYAIVGFPSIIRNVHLLCDLLKYRIDTYSWQTPQEVDILLEDLRKKNYDMILCDMVADTRAKYHALNSILITSGIESIEAAIDQAIRVSKSYHCMKHDKQLFQILLEHQNEEVVVFNEEKACCYSTLYSLEYEQIYPIFSKAMNSPRDGNEELIKREISSYIVSIRHRLVQVDGSVYHIFYVSCQPLSCAGRKNGIFYYQHEDVLELFLKHFHGISLQAAGSNLSSEELAQSPYPIMLLGEIGTGKQQVVADLYCKSPLRDHPLIQLDFTVLDEKTLRYLFTNINSPFHDSDLSFHMKGLEGFSRSQLLELATWLNDFNLCKRNRVYCSYAVQPDQSVPEDAMYFSDLLSCITVKLPPLRERSSEISTLACMYMATMNLELAKQAIGFESEALTLLMEYSWPRNLLQFRRVIRQVVALSKTPYIPGELVKNVLNEDILQRKEPRPQTALPLDRTLAEINAEIVRSVLANCDGNQSKAAKQLGISRTTLWRMIKK